MFRQFFAGLPRELEDAAMLDGAGRFTTFSRIMLPNCGAAIAVATIFAFQSFWTDLSEPVVYLHSPEHYTLALGLASLIGTEVTHIGPLMAGLVLMLVPMLALFLIAQRFLVDHLSLPRLTR